MDLDTRVKALFAQEAKHTPYNCHVKCACVTVDVGNIRPRNTNFQEANLKGLYCKGTRLTTTPKEERQTASRTIETRFHNYHCSEKPTQ